MDCKVIYTSRSQKDLKRLSLDVVKRILEKVQAYSQLKDPMEMAKKLKGFKQETFRFRVGDYRVVFRKDPQTQSLVILVVLRVAHRSEVYKKEL